MLELRYKQNAAEVIERLRLLHERRAQDQIFATFSLPSRALEQFGRQYG